MAEHEKPESGVGKVNAVIEQTGLPSTLKGHAQRLLMRWLAGTIAHPYFQTVRYNLDTIEGRSRVNMMLADEVGRLAVADPQQVERAATRFGIDFIRKQENVEAVAVAANANVSDDPTESKPEREPSTDWMNAFTREAENASSDDLRDRLASILAGEIKRPGRFSRSTLRLVSDLEQDSLLKFERVLANRVGRAIYAPPDWSSGEFYLIGLELREIGLISDTVTSRSMNGDSNNNAFFLGDDYGLAAQYATANVEKSVTIWVLTKSGFELAGLRPARDERVPLRTLASNLDKNLIKKIFIGKVTPLGNERANVAMEETVFTNAPPPVVPPVISPNASFSFGIRP